MRKLWNVIKGICTVTGIYVWIKAIKETVEEYNELKDEPLVQPVMLMGRHNKK